MKIRVIIYGLILTLSTNFTALGQDDYVQESRLKPFKVLIIAPDKAVIDDSLRLFTDSIELEYRDSYYKKIKELETKRKSDNRKERKSTNNMLKRLKDSEEDVLSFKYQQMISVSTLVSLNEYFQKYPWEEAGAFYCRMIYKKGFQPSDLPKLTNDFKVDYVVYYENIRAERLKTNYKMTMTTFMFSKADSKIILQKETSGTTNQWVCDYPKLNPLACLMTRLEDNTTNELYYVLNDRQKK